MSLPNRPFKRQHGQLKDDQNSEAVPTFNRRVQQRRLESQPQQQEPVESDFDVWFNTLNQNYRADHSFPVNRYRDYHSKYNCPNDSLLINSVVGQTILTSLVQHNQCSHLRQLTLTRKCDTSIDFWQALKDYLHAIPVPLEHLALESIAFELPSLGMLLDGLKGRDGRSKTVTTVSKLTIFSCSFWRSSLYMLHEFMHTPIEKSNENMSLRELVIDGIAVACDQTRVMWATFTPSELVTMLAMQPTVRPPIHIHHECFFASPGFRGRAYHQGKDLHPPAPLVDESQCGLTIGSSIPVISASLDPNTGRCFPGFLAELARHANRIVRLSTLHVFDDNVHALAQCIDRIASLRTLIFNHAGGMDAAPPVLRSLKTNGRIESIKGKVTSQRAEAYAERNRFLQQLRQADQLNRTIPMTELLMVEQQVPSTQSTLLLHTLRKLPDSAGN